MRFRIPKYFPGWFVSGGGGSGGSGTVQTDGVTIQGDGSAGNKIAIKAVQTRARLTGAGTVASPLDVAGWPLTAYLSSFTDAGNNANTANKLVIAGFYLAAPLTFATIGYRLGTVGAPDPFDLGIYTLTGTLVANIGSTTKGGAGVYDTATLQGAQTIAPASYIFAFTSSANGVGMSGDPSVINFCFQTGYGSSAAATLPASITAPTLASALGTLSFTLH